MPFLIALKIKYLGVSLTKNMYDLPAESYKLLTKEIKEDLSQQRGILCSGNRRLKLIHRLNEIPVKSPKYFL
jgi:hypothetical protein